MTCPVNVSLSGGYPDGRTRRPAGGGDGRVLATYMCPSAGGAPSTGWVMAPPGHGGSPVKIAKALDVSRAPIYRHLAAEGE